MTTAATSTVTDTLDRYATMTRDAMRRRIVRSDANRWLDDIVADYPNRPGKALRPAILLATCQAFGGTVDEALGAAVSIELLHNAFLVHDDIQDASLMRRGSPTLHRKHGMPLALNAGDALALMALDALRFDERLGSRVSQRLTVEFHNMARQSIEGQATELGWRRDGVVDLTPDDYLDLVGRKTCWYTTIYPLRAGALIGSRATFPLSELNHFGYYLGSAFQIRDDLLNLVGSEEQYGKEVLGDIREGKRTLMMIHLLQQADPAERRFVVEFLTRPVDQRSGTDIAEVMELMRRNGCIEMAMEYGRGIGAAAYEAYDRSFRTVPHSEHRDFLRDLIAFMLDRSL